MIFLVTFPVGIIAARHPGKDDQCARLHRAPEMAGQIGEGFVFSSSYRAFSLYRMAEPREGREDEFSLGKTIL